MSEAFNNDRRLVPLGSRCGFIPLANALLPRLVLRDISHSSTQQRGEGEASSRSAWLGLAGELRGLQRLCVGYGRHGAVDGDYESWQTGYLLLAVGGGGLAVSRFLELLHPRPYEISQLGYRFSLTKGGFLDLCDSAVSLPAIVWFHE